MSGTTDIYGFNISDDDEEEFHPGTDDNDTDKENDAYVSVKMIFLRVDTGFGSRNHPTSREYPCPDKHGHE